MQKVLQYFDAKKVYVLLFGGYYMRCSFSRLRFVTVNTIKLLLFVRKTNRANRSLSGTAILPGPWDGVTNATISQPTSITAVISQQLPGSVDMAHLCDLGSIVLACSHSPIIGQLLWLDQVVKSSFDWRGELRVFSYRKVAFDDQ